MKMRDRRGYEADDLKKMAKDVEKKGGRKMYEKDRRMESKDYKKDSKASRPSGSMCRGR